MTQPLDASVLVLNKHFIAIQVCNAREAIIALYKGQAKVINEEWRTFNFGEWELESSFIIDTEEEKKYPGVVHSPNHWVVVPQVIVLTDCEQNIPDFKEVRFSRKNVMLRDMFICQYCGYKGTTGELTLDHVVPKSRGGDNSYKNIVTACKNCNQKKANMTPVEAGMKLINKPNVPRWRSHVGSSFNLTKKPYWKVFLK